MTVAFPYRTADSTSVNLGGWLLIGEGGQPDPILGCIPGWDYDTNLTLFRRAELKPIEILRGTALAEHDADLTLNVIALTGPSCYRQIIFSESIPADESWSCEIELSLDSRELAEMLTLKTEIVLGAAIEHDAPFVASETGSRLYEETEKIQLEGSLGRFPMELVDFDVSLPGLRTGNAMWFLDWDPARPEARFLGAVLLYINAAHKEISERIRDGESVITTVLRCDVIRAMCEGMLRNEEFVAGSDYYDPDTVGGQVREWLLEAFGEMSTETLKVMMQSLPGRFEARLQEAFS